MGLTILFKSEYSLHIKGKIQTHVRCFVKLEGQKRRQIIGVVKI